MITSAERESRSLSGIAGIEPFLPAMASTMVWKEKDIEKVCEGRQEQKSFSEKVGPSQLTFDSLCPASPRSTAQYAIAPARSTAQRA